jgi:hypothetical protein
MDDDFMLFVANEMTVWLGGDAIEHLLELEYQARIAGDHATADEWLRIAGAAALLYQV